MNILKKLFGLVFVASLFYNCNTPTEYIVETVVVYDTLSVDTTYIVIGETQGVYALFGEASMVQWPGEDPGLGVYYYMHVTRVDTGLPIERLIGHGVLFSVDSLWNPVQIVEHNQRELEIETGDTAWVAYTTGDASFYGSGRYTYEQLQTMIGKFGIEERND